MTLAARTLHTSPITLGIDIGSTVVKMMLVERVASRVDIHGAGSFDLAAGMVVDGVIQNRRAFARRLRQELDAFPTKPANAMVSIPSNLAALRWVALPEASDEERREAARFKVKRHLPYPVEEAYVAVTPRQTGGSGQEQTLVIAVRKDVVDSRAEALVAAGVNPVGAELEAQSILRVVDRYLRDRSPLWRDSSITIIDVGVRNTHMYVVQSQRLQFIRGVKFGADIIAEAISHNLDVPLSEAHGLLDHPEARLMPNGMLQTPMNDAIAVVNIAPELGKLTMEFSRLLRYFRSLHPERSYAGILDRAILCGGLVGLDGFCTYLQQSLGLKVDRARPFADTVAQFSLSTFKNLANRQEAYSVVMGLALASFGTGSTQSNAANDRNEFSWIRTA